MSRLFSPFTLRGVTFRNRLWVSPMCQYSAKDGVPNAWHLVHLGSRAVGGAGLVLAEATGVVPEGRISPEDTGLWNDEQERAWAPIAAFIKESGARAGIQLAHAGRKASTAAPWRGGGYVHPDDGGWETVGPSAIAFGSFPVPRALSEDEIQQVIAAFAASATRALNAGFEVIELHAAHGYLLHQFLSPLSNQRQDRYGGSFDNRLRIVLETVRAIRAVWPEEKPLMMRVSATDWMDGGWDLPSTVELARRAKALGVDLVDCSSGALVKGAKIPEGPGYQVPFSRAVRHEAGIPTAAVGLLTGPRQFEEVLANEDADAVFVAREFLRDPYLPLHTANELEHELEWPVQYRRAAPVKD